MPRLLALLATVSLIALGSAAAAQEAEATPETTPETTPEAPAADAPAADAAPAAAPSRDDVIATVNGETITLGEMIIAVAQLPPQYQQLPADVLFMGILDQIVQQELLAQTVTEAPARVDLSLAVERRSLLAGEAIEALSGIAPDEAALQAAYDATYGQAEPVLEYSASHILVPTAEEAQAVIDRIGAGEDFAAVAAEVSTDTGSGAQGGSLGWFEGAMMVPEFTAGVETLVGQPEGTLSAPVQSDFGWHVIRLDDTRERPAPTLEEVRPELEAQLRQQTIEARLAELTAAAEVTRTEPGAIDPAILTDLSLLED